MDDIRAIRELKSLGHTLARERQPDLDSVFFTELAETFHPVYPN